MSPINQYQICNVLDVIKGRNGDDDVKSLKVKMIKGGTFKEFTRNIRRFSLLELNLLKDNQNNSLITETPQYTNMIHLHINKTVSIQVTSHTFSAIVNSLFGYIVSFVRWTQLKHDSENNNSFNLRNEHLFWNEKYPGIIL